MNNRGSKVISIYWFAILFIVAGAVVYMTVIFYGQPKDVRGIEASVLTNRIADCLSESGYLKEEVLNDAEFKDNFLQRCSINFSVEEAYDWIEQEQYYTEINIHNFDENSVDGFGEKIFETSAGNINLKTTFLLEKAEEGGGLEKDIVVIHFTASPTLKSAEGEFYRTDHKSIHYIVDKDGTIVKGEVEEGEEAYHSGCLLTRPKCHSDDEKPNPEIYEKDDNCCMRGINKISIGIELVNLGNMCEDTETRLCDFGGGETCKDFCENMGKGTEINGIVWEKYSEEQIDALAYLVSEIVSRHNIPIDREHIIGHEEVDPGRKVDPGPAFPWDEFMSKIQKIEGLDSLDSGIGRNLYALDKSRNQYAIKILSITGKTEKNVV